MYVCRLQTEISFSFPRTFIRMPGGIMKAGKGWNYREAIAPGAVQWLLCLFLERDYQRIITFLTEFPAFTTYMPGDTAVGGDS